MTKTTQKSAKVLAIHSKGKDFFHTLAWWNLSRIKVTDIDYIVIHQGKGTISEAFKLKRDSKGLYVMIDEFSNQKAKVPYVETTFPDGSKRVSFVDFTFYSVDDELLHDMISNLKLPKTKQGQAQPLQIFNVDLATMTIIPTVKKTAAKKATEKQA